MSAAPRKMGLQIPATPSLPNSYLLLTSLLLVMMCLQQAPNTTMHSFVHCFFYLLRESLLCALQGMLPWVTQGPILQELRTGRKRHGRWQETSVAAQLGYIGHRRRSPSMGSHWTNVLGSDLYQQTGSYYKGKTRSTKMIKEGSGHASRCPFISEPVAWDQEGTNGNGYQFWNARACGHGEGIQIIPVHCKMGNASLFGVCFSSRGGYNFLLISPQILIVDRGMFHHLLLERKLLKNGTPEMFFLPPSSASLLRLPTRVPIRDPCQDVGRCRHRWSKNEAETTNSFLTDDQTGINW